jgi:hypothetical protein
MSDSSKPNASETTSSSPSASVIVTVVLLTVFIVSLIVGVAAPSIGVIGYVSRVCLSLSIFILGVFMLVMFVLGVSDFIKPNKPATKNPEQRDQTTSSELPEDATQASDNSEASSPKGCLLMALLGIVSIGLVIGGLALGFSAILDVPYLTNPPTVYLENARCDIEESTDGDGDTHTHYYLRGTDETGKEYSFTVDEDVSSQISDGYVRVRYLPNTSVIMEVEY